MPNNEFQVNINGTAFSGSSVRVNIAGVSLPSLQAVKWKKKANKENLYGAGRNVNSRGYGRNEFEASITVLVSDLNSLENAAPNNSYDITKIPPFDIVVALVEGTSVVSYTLEACEFMEWGMDAKTADMSIPIELPLIIADVKRTR